jgi:uncharacterized membrane-anchored protein
MREILRGGEFEDIMSERFGLGLEEGSSMLMLCLHVGLGYWFH